MKLRGPLAAVATMLPLVLGVQVLCVGLGPSAATAADDDQEPIDIEALAKQRTASMLMNPPSARVTRYLTAAGEDMAEGKLGEARILLERLNLDRMNHYERAQVFRLFAYVSYQLGEADRALEYFEKALAEEALPLKDDVGIMFNVVQLHAALGQWPEVIESLKRWRRYTHEWTPRSYYLEAVAHYQMEEYDLAIPPAKKAIELSDKPEESWLQILAALYVTKQDYEAVTPILEQLVVRFPKKSYWVQLSLIYGARNDYRHSLAVQQVAYLQGFLDEDRELRRLARSYVFAGLPYQAAHVLEKGLEEGKIDKDAEAYEFLANSWIQAREFERSLEPLREAAELSEGGDLYVRLGQVHMAREQWSDAVDLLKKALDKGELTNPGSAQLLLGIAYYNDKRVGPARFSFARAREYEKTKKAADDWLRHIEKESQSG